MLKYQFHIGFNDKANTAASKAVQDCKSILSEMGYQDFSVEDLLLSSRFYLLKLLGRLTKFLLKIKPDSLVAIQFPLLSGNAYFGYFIKAARLKKVRFFCVVHDLNDLRHVGDNDNLNRDVDALNYYDFVIVHNQFMKEWLVKNGLKSATVILHAFDYLSVIEGLNAPILKPREFKTIVFAGNLSKSRFIYSLDVVKDWQFNLYGPNYSPEKGSVVKNICWNGSFSPDEIVTVMRGDFGLVWDGEDIDRLDMAYGNYLKFNYPHKLSLYLAAGMPVIAPRDSAAASFVTQHGIGLIIGNLLELTDLVVSEEDYQQMAANARKVGADIRAGKYFFTAVAEIESEIFSEEHHLEAQDASTKTQYS